jgi:hypothetical protein
VATWLNHVSIGAPRNGTSSHTVTPSSGTVLSGTLFTPTAGRLLVVVVEGAVTASTPSGWTLPTGGSAVNNTGLYVWYRTAAGSDSLTTTHNGSNYPVVFDFYEFASGSTFSGSAASTGVPKSGGAGPTLSGLTGTNLTFGVAALPQTAGGAAEPTASFTWTSGTELVDVQVAPSGTDGYYFGVTYTEDNTASSASYNASHSYTNINVTSMERLVFGVKVAASGTNFNGTSSIAATSAITAAGTVGKVTGAALAATSTITTAGTVGRASGADLAATSTITASGGVAASTGASLAATATITAAGTVTSGFSGGATLSATDTITATGVVGASTGSSAAATAAITAAGVVGKSTGSSLAATAAITATGVKGVTTGASLAATATITASGTVVSGTSRAASLAATAAIAATGVLGVSRGAGVAAAASITAIGTVASSGTAGITATAIVTADGVVGTAGTGTAALNATATITADGTVGLAAPRMYRFSPATRPQWFSYDEDLFLWKRVSYPEGVTVVKTVSGGYRQEVFHITDAPDIAKVYLGGHEHLVDEDEAASLTAAGYGSFLTEVPS